MKGGKKEFASLVRDSRRYLTQLREEGVASVAAEKTEQELSRGTHPPRRARTAPPPPGNRLQSLEEKIRKCRKCPLFSTRTRAVPGEGGMKKKIMFIGEGPGANEDRQGRPFVGRAGQLLDRILASIDLARGDVYITNVVKCRPPGNRDPRPDEIVACWPYLEEQIKLLKPRVIVALGAPAARTLLETDTGISRLRGIFHDYEGIPLLPTYHPAFLLRSYTKDNRQKVWDDMKKLKDFIEGKE